MLDVRKAKEHSIWPIYHRSIFNLWHYFLQNACLVPYLYNYFFSFSPPSTLSHFSTYFTHTESLWLNSTSWSFPPNPCNNLILVYKIVDSVDLHSESRKVKIEGIQNQELGKYFHYEDKPAGESGSGFDTWNLNQTGF